MSLGCVFFKRIGFVQVYVRPAGSYVMDQLELRRVNFYPGQNNAVDILILIANFSIPTGLRSAEAALSNQKVLPFLFMGSKFAPFSHVSPSVPDLSSLNLGWILM